MLGKVTCPVFMGRAMIRQEVARALSERMGQERLSWGGVVGDIWDGLQQGDAVQVCACALHRA